MRVAFAGLFALALPCAGAQSTTTPPSRAAASASLASIAGLVLDSLHNAPLAAATVHIVGTERRGITGADGHFHIDSIAPGEHQLTVSHPLLDTLGLSITTRPVALAAGATTEVLLATPSEETILDLACPASVRRVRGPGVLVGRVRDADTDQPAAGTRVTLVWSEMTVGQDIGIRKAPRVREATVGPDGTYKICGLPIPLNGTLQASRAGITTAEVPVVFEDRALMMRSLGIGNTEVVAAAPPDTAAHAGQRPTAAAAAATVAQPAPKLRSGSASISGRVVNGAGAPVPGAQVGVTGTPATTVTRTDGGFTLSGLPSGTQALVVRQIGFAPVEQPVELSARAPQRVTVTLRAATPVLETVRVQAAANDEYAKVGFTNRKRAGLGHFLTADEIDKRSARQISDILGTMPGLRTRSAGAYNVIQSTRGGCVAYYLDRSPFTSMTPGDVDQAMPPSEIAAIEVYDPSTVPAEFTTSATTSCTTIVIWSKGRMRDRK